MFQKMFVAIKIEIIFTRSSLNVKTDAFLRVKT